MEPIVQMACSLLHSQSSSQPISLDMCERTFLQTALNSYKGPAVEKKLSPPPCKHGMDVRTIVYGGWRMIETGGALSTTATTVQHYYGKQKVTAPTHVFFPHTIIMKMIVYLGELRTTTVCLVHDAILLCSRTMDS